MGPIRPESYPDGNRFLAIFMNDYSKVAQTYPIVHKNDSGKCLEKFLVTVSNLIGKDEKACYIGTDKGTEFTESEFSKMMRRENIKRQLTPPDTPELNGVSEMFNKTIEWKIRALMLDSGLSNSMWGLAAKVTTHLYNRTPHKGIN